MTELLTGAHLADGTGAALHHADVLLDHDRITAVAPPGTLPRHHPHRDLTGLVLAPGFIDSHSHADNAPLLTEHDTTKVLQGVTTEVVGNCGFSLAPRTTTHDNEHRELLHRLFPPLHATWTGFTELFAATDAAGHVTNHCPLVGHGTLRVAATGMTQAAPDTDALRQMRALLEEAMGAGAFGLSSGLIYPPATFATTTELTALAEVLGGDGLYATHMRDEGDHLLDAIDEALHIGRAAGRTHLSHLKSTGPSNWGAMPSALERIQHARSTGQVVHQDVYPYTASSTTLTALLPAHYLSGNARHTLEKLTAPGVHAELTDALTGSTRFDRILIATTTSHRHEGRTLTEIATASDTDPVQVLIDLLVTEELRVAMIHFSMHEDDLEHALRDPRTAIGSDGLPPGNGGTPHPRLTSTFPRFLGRYVRGRGVLDLPEAVRRMTSLPAEIFRIPDRGVITPGRIADLVAFDPATVLDVGDYRDPLRPPTGVPWVCLAGQTVVEAGEFLGIPAGRRLSPSA
ncbi:D-aminoacylase [Saccharopolyspora rhizosphaerae]|uniref:D-aminoacylase n=1 Tax=Saccharopolyspora rhizosphaerae TaxID=2492662 RepID=A0A426K597_9PSEU|nr:D-aminoacylase [Saccharopolyspora rhizosphaerae]RRO20568.1 D-aminoacylase [Saccharopolyspora rhizosphaerae]